MRTERNTWVWTWVWAIGVWLALFALLLFPLYLLSHDPSWSDYASSVSHAPGP